MKTAEANNTGEGSGADERTEEASEEVNRTETRQKNP